MYVQNITLEVAKGIVQAAYRAIPAQRAIERLTNPGRLALVDVGACTLTAYPGRSEVVLEGPQDDADYWLGLVES